MTKKLKIFCTLGPSSMNEDVIKKLDALSVDVFRINLSHTEIDDLEGVIDIVRKYTAKPICLDTEGAQVRVGRVANGQIYINEMQTIEITGAACIGNAKKISLTPGFVTGALQPGDLLSVDFDSVLLLVTKCDKNPAAAKAVSGGFIGSNKAVTIDRKIDLPVVSDKDMAAIKVGMRKGIKHYALSFASDKQSVLYFRKLVGKNSHVISKIESSRGLENVDDIIEASDSILIDRGDLSREEPVEKIPFIQKYIIRRANIKNKPVYVATNLLESMVKSKNPTRAELNDIVNTLIDGADGLVLAAETAIGAYPVNAVTMISRAIKQYTDVKISGSLKDLQRHVPLMLVEPHGGVLVDRMIELPEKEVKKYKTLYVKKTVLLDAEQIAIGTFSPLEGFMTKKELDRVLKHYRLPSGVVWTLPVVLQVQAEDAAGFKDIDRAALALEGTHDVYAILDVEDIYKYDLEKMALSTFGTMDMRHPGVASMLSGGDHFISGKVGMLKRLPSEYKHYEIMPKQARTIFENKGWGSVVGFHTRNVIHRAHEHIQRLAMDISKCDGIFIHPLVGPKKSGDYSKEVILKSYEIMIERYYPRGRALLGAFQTYPRYAGPREAVFTALCRKNFGCSHFIVGRDHSGVGSYFKSHNVMKFFDSLGDLGIKPIFFNEMYYCKLCRRYVERCGHETKHVAYISGSKTRDMFRANRRPPEWFMRGDISNMILDELYNKREVFSL